MKVKKAETQKRADELGDHYMKFKERYGDIDADRANTVSSIFTLADEVGVKEGKRVVVYGKRFVVGKIKPEPSMSIDFDRLFKLRPSLKKKLMILVPSEKLLEEAIKSGRVTRATLKKCLVPSNREFNPKVYVQALRKKGSKVSNENNEPNE
jgi:hypothetical protein